MSKIILTGLIILNFIGISISQEVTMNKTLEYLNKKLKGQCEFELNDNKLTADFYKDEEKIRTDNVFVENLNFEAFTYNQDEGAIILRCYENESGCIMRNIYKQKAKKTYDRMAINVEGFEQKSIDGLLSAFKFMCRKIVEPDYQLYEFFE